MLSYKAATVGQADEVVKDLYKNPQLFCEVFEGMLHDDPLIAMRATDTIEKFTREYPEYLQSFKNKLINKVAKVQQQEVRWHIALVFSRLPLTSKEKAKVVRLLQSWLKNEKRPDCKSLFFTSFS